MSERDKLESYFESIATRFTPEYFEQLSKDSYKTDREYPENFSNWYPHILDFGNFKTAEIIANQIFTWEETEIMRQNEEIDQVDFEKIKEILKPTIDKLQPYRNYNIKNGCFSNKFDYKTSIVTKGNIAKQLWIVNYQSALFETGGYTELVVRELIPYDATKQLMIYNGMPLREEVRVFYNMDTKEIEYMVDYWDYNYCRPNIRNRNDQIIFDVFHNKLPGREIQHNEKLKEVQDMISENINTLKFDDTLTGIWSIDFMYDEDSGSVYLIDIARGFRSAYWNYKKTKEGRNNESI